MKETFYKKVGRRYVPVYEYDSDLCSSLPKGTHLVMTYPGGSSTRYNIDPAYAPLIAAARVAQDVMSKALYEASELRPRQRPITEEQRQAWLNLQQAFGDDMYSLQTESAQGIAEVGVKALQEEADKLMKHESVKRAYEQFLLVCQLTKQENT